MAEINQHDPGAPLFGDEPQASSLDPAAKAVRPLYDPMTGQRLHDAEEPAKPAGRDPSWRYDPTTGQRLPDDPNRELVEGQDYVKSYHESGRHDLPQQDVRPQPGGELARPERAS